MQFASSTILVILDNVPVDVKRFAHGLAQRCLTWSGKTSIIFRAGGFAEK
jgi:hypothetical protein